MIGLGLCDEHDITVRGLNALRTCDRVYLEAYTSILTVGTDRLEAFYGKKVIVADRTMVESATDDILSHALVGNVAFLVVGDPYGATTHSDLAIRARMQGVAVTVIHNASIINAVGANGLQLYNYGQVLTANSDSQHLLPHRHLEARQLLRQDQTERTHCPAHSLSARHQGQGAEHRESR